MKRKFLAWLMTLAMVVNMVVPYAAYADELPIGDDIYVSADGTDLNNDDTTDDVEDEPTVGEPSTDDEPAAGEPSDEEPAVDPVDGNENNAESDGKEGEPVGEPAGDEEPVVDDEPQGDDNPVVGAVPQVAAFATPQSDVMLVADGTPETQTHYLKQLGIANNSGNAQKSSSWRIIPETGVFEYNTKKDFQANWKDVYVSAVLADDAPEGAKISVSYTDTNNISQAVDVTIGENFATAIPNLIQQGVTPKTITIKVGTDTDYRTYTIHITRCVWMTVPNPTDENDVKLTKDSSGNYVLPLGSSKIKITATSFGTTATLTVNDTPVTSGVATEITPDFSGADGIFTMVIKVQDGDLSKTSTYNFVQEKDELSGNCGDNISFEYKSGVLTIKGSGDMLNYTTSNKAPWADKASKIETVSLADGITSIGDYAFADCKLIEETVLPTSVTSIGQCAFLNAARFRCNLHEGITKIGNNAFQNTYMQNVTIPSSVTDLGQSAFYQCSALESATINGKMSPYMFNGCTALKTVTFNGTALKEIPSYSFSGCTALKELNMPEGVESLGSQGLNFQLEKVTIPSTFRADISGSMFESVTDITVNKAGYTKDGKILYNADKTKIILAEKDLSGKVTIPATVETIGTYAFYNCKAITKVAIPANVKTIESWAFRYCESMTELDLTDGLETIGDNAFNGCKGLAEVKIPESVTTISSSFAGCSKLKIIEIPSKVTKISTYGFGSCTALETIILPAGIKEITGYTNGDIQYAPNIKKIYFRGDMAAWDAVTGVGKPTDDKYDIVFNYGRTDVPIITVQPKDGFFSKDEDVTRALSVTVTKPAGVDVTMEWYVNDTKSRTGGTKLSNTSVSDDGLTSYCTPDSSAYGTKYYYCVITATVGEQTVTAGTNIATVEISTVKWTGDGTEDKPFLINNAEELQMLYEFVSKDKVTSGRYWKLMDNITLPADWEPIGITRDGSNNVDGTSNLLAFSGTFDGNNKQVTVPEGGKPLFGYVNGATIKNLDVYGKKIDGYGLVNNLIGRNIDGCAVLIDNVTLKNGSATRRAGFIGTEINPVVNGYAGCGGNFYVTIQNCTVEENVVIGYGKDQSMIGSFSGRMHGTIDNCKSAATVYGVDCVGGIAGATDNAMGGLTVKNCEFTGKVIATGKHIGGIVGSGYTASSAPNGLKTNILNCKVTGEVTGKDYVGGILGSDQWVAQGWSGTMLTNNYFGGKLTADATAQYKGAIIGWYRSLNRTDNIQNNGYATTCGVSEPVGYVQFIDTNCENHETVYEQKGTQYFSTEKGSAYCPEVYGCWWTAGYNRTDDPLGADSGKLFYVSDTIKDCVTEFKMTTADNFKTTYYIGDKLDLTGATFTAKWSNGITETVSADKLTVSGFESERAQKMTVTVSYQGLSVDFDVTIVKKSDSGATTPTQKTISVYVTFSNAGEFAESKNGKELHKVSLNVYDVDGDGKYTMGDAFAVLHEEYYEDGLDGYSDLYSAEGGWIKKFWGDNSGNLGLVKNHKWVSGVKTTITGGNVLDVYSYADETGYTDLYTYFTKDSYSAKTGAETTFTVSAFNVMLSDEKGEATAKPKGATVTVYKDGKELDNFATQTDENGQFTLIFADPGLYTIDVTGTCSYSCEGGYGSGSYSNAPVVPSRCTVSVGGQSTGGSGGAVGATTETNYTATEVIDLIDAIGTVTKDSKSVIEKARAAYDSLTEAQQKKVTNYDKLTAAEAKYTELTGEKIEVTTGSDLPFADVTKGSWYYDAIKAMYDKGLMNGESEKQFMPNNKLSRAMLVTILYRLAEQPEVSADALFDDVAAGQWYTKAVAWASSNNIVSGVGEGKFAPNASITRQELAAMLYRYASAVGLNTTATANLGSFTDSNSVATWAETAMQWAVGSGLIKGDENGALNPTGTATRAEVATVIVRLIEMSAK